MSVSQQSGLQGDPQALVQAVPQDSPQALPPELLPDLPPDLPPPLELRKTVGLLEAACEVHFSFICECGNFDTLVNILAKLTEFVRVGGVRPATVVTTCVSEGRWTAMLRVQHDIETSGAVLTCYLASTGLLDPDTLVGISKDIRDHINDQSALKGTHRGLGNIIKNSLHVIAISLHSLTRKSAADVIRELNAQKEVEDSVDCPGTTICTLPGRALMSIKEVCLFEVQDGRSTYLDRQLLQSPLWQEDEYQGPLPLGVHRMQRVRHGEDVFALVSVHKLRTFREAAAVWPVIAGPESLMGDVVLSAGVRPGADPGTVEPQPVSGDATDSVVKAPTQPVAQ